VNYRKLGKLGWKISEIGFGGWAIGGTSWGSQKDDDSLRALRAAVELGCNFIDTAQGYGDGRSEQVIGRIPEGK
jgi:aryl-alcohol dehydrogenase-like predicted oxidoreductase